MPKPIGERVIQSLSRFFHRQRLERWAFVAQIISAFAVTASLLFLAQQQRYANKVASRTEAVAAQTQWSAFRSSIYGDRDVAFVFRSGLDGRQLDPADRLRFVYLMREHAWATYQQWVRVELRLRTRNRFFAGAGPEFLRVICTPGGRITWATIKRELPSPYVADLDRLMDAYSKARSVRCTP